MTVQKVDINNAYRLLQLGPTTMLSSKYDGIEDVMACAWIGIGGPNRVIAYIGKQAFTRGLIEKSGYFVVHIPVAAQMETVLYAGENSRFTNNDKTSSFDLFYQPEFDLPMVKGCAGWIVCKVIENKSVQEKDDLFFAEMVSAWSDDRVFRNGHWHFEEAPDELRTFHYVADGQFYSIGNGTKFNHGPGEDPFF